MPMRWDLKDLNGETNSLLAANEITVVGYDELDREQVRTTIESASVETQVSRVYNKHEETAAGEMAAVFSTG
ncbi:MAG: hypothetical protein ACQEXQ_28625 [Bacillota bacterium]